MTPTPAPPDQPRRADRLSEDRPPTTTRRSRRILMVAPTSFFADYGCHVRILEEARVLQRLGQEVTIATYYNGRDRRELDIRRTLPIPWRKDYEVGSSRHKLAFDALLGVTSLLAGLSVRPDIVHGHLHEGALIGAAVARLLRRPLVFDFQGSLTAEMVDHRFLNPNGHIFGKVRRAEAWINGLPDAVVTSTQHGADHLLDEFDVDEDKVYALPDCVNARRFRPDVLTGDRRRRNRRALGVPEGRDVVVYLGLLAAHQGTDLLLDAARTVVGRRPNTHFLIMGFPGTEVYNERVRALGLSDHATLTGRVPYEAAASRLALGDVAVAPKVSATEGSGKILNYMAMGLPTVAFDTQVSREYLGDDGVYAKRGDAIALADTLIELLDDANRRKLLSERLRQRAVAEYDWGPAGRQLLEIYDRVSGQGGSP